MRLDWIRGRSRLVTVALLAVAMVVVAGDCDQALDDVSVLLGQPVRGG